jgi:hypothetical protein
MHAIREESILSGITGDRQDGFLLVDAVLGLTVLTIGILAFLFAFQMSFRVTSDVGVEDHVDAAMENAVETLGAAGFSTLYATYQGAKLPAADVLAPDGTPATVQISFDVNETALPLEYGPVTDIDGDGLKGTPNASGHYLLLPTRLTIDYLMSYGPERKEVFLLLAGS